MAVKAGALRFNTDSNKLELYDGNQWTQIVATSPEAQTGGVLGLIAGGWAVPAPSDIDKLTISTTGDAIDYGDLSVARYAIHGASDRTRGVFAGGRNDPSPAAPSTTVDFLAIASGGTATSFGSLTTPASSGTRGNIGNSTRGIFARLDGNTINYITIQSTGSVQDFGDLVNDTFGGSGAACSQTRGIVFGRTGGATNIDYITTSTLGNASDFGDLTQAFQNCAGTSNAVRSVIACGTGPSQPAGIGSNILEFVTISTLGNSVDFGDVAAFRSRGACSSPTRGVFAGGADPGTNTIDYVQIMSTGDAIDFGDLNGNSEAPGSCSNGHGGL